MHCLYQISLHYVNSLQARRFDVPVVDSELPLYGRGRSSMWTETRSLTPRSHTSTFCSEACSPRGEVRSSIFRFSMGLDRKRRNSGRKNIPDTIPEPVTRVQAGEGFSIPAKAPDHRREAIAARLFRDSIKIAMKSVREEASECRTAL